MQACAAVPALARNKAPRDLARSLKRPLNPDAQACPPPPTNQMPAFSGQVLLRERASCTIPARGPFPWLAPSRTTECCTLSRQRVHRAPNLGYLCRTARHRHTPSFTLAPFFRLLRLVCLANVSSALFNLQHSLSLFLISQFGAHVPYFSTTTSTSQSSSTYPLSFISHSVLIAQLSFLGASESAAQQHAPTVSRPRIFDSFDQPHFTAESGKRELEVVHEQPVRYERRQRQQLLGDTSWIGL